MPPDRRTRFAPSPTGLLHLGHAYAAVVGARRADPGGFLVRIEDLDTARCKPEFVTAIFQDLAWLGLDWPRPVLHQSTRMAAYRTALNRLIDMGICYPCGCSRGDIRAAASAPQEGAAVHGPDGMVYPGTCRNRGMDTARPGDAIRLNMAKTLQRLQRMPDFVESGPNRLGHHRLDPARACAEIGDIVLSRRDSGAAYHLAVVVDDAAQDITEVTRGEDLFAATFIHVLLQMLLQLPTPSYYHHTLIRDKNGVRLAKRDDARAIARYRADGLSPAAVLALVGLHG